MPVILVPKPRSNLTQFVYRPGGFAANSSFRRAVGPGSAKPSRNTSRKPTIQTAAETSVDQALPCSPLRWAERLKRVFNIDISVCPPAKARAAKRSLCRYLMMETTAAHLSLSQPKSTLANRPSLAQLITTSHGSVSLLQSYGYNLP